MPLKGKRESYQTTSDGRDDQGQTVWTNDSNKQQEADTPQQEAVPQWTLPGNL